MILSRSFFWAAVVGSTAAAFILSSLACDSFKVTNLYVDGIVVSVSPIASEVGRDILEQGGNAFDAAIAVSFVLAVTYPQAGNLGGGGFAVLRDAITGDIVSLDFRETAPGLATDTMYLDGSGEVIGSLSTEGALAAGVPGTVAGLYAMWDKYGSMPWPDLVTVAARLADTGFVVDSFLADLLAAKREKLSQFESTRNCFMPGGSPTRVGDKFQQPDLARTLYLIAADGPEPFYQGEIADQIVACMENHAGIISAADLESYRPTWREPVHFKFDSLDIYSMAPPSSGGIMLGEILGLLEPFDFGRYTPASPEFIHLFSEASRLAFADRAAHLGDPKFFEIPTGLLDSAYLARRRELIPQDQAGSSAETRPGNPLKPEPGETTHFSICDKAGNMVALTTTLNSNFGSGLVVDGAGFLLNNEMDDFSVKPGHANIWGLVGGEANKIASGKRMLSSMAPTLVLKDDQPFMILGSPGGSKIITIVAQAIINFTRFDLSLQETVDQPRFHHQWLPDMIYLEEQSFGVATIQRLIRYGHDVQERTAYGDLEIIYIRPNGLMSGATDSRRGGLVAGCAEPTIN